MDLWHRILNFLDRERGKVAGLVLAGIVAAWIVGCQPTTTSTLTPGQRVTPTALAREVAVAQGQFDKRAAVIDLTTNELNADIASYNRKLEVAEADLKQQIALRKRIIEAVGGLGTAIAEGNFSPSAAIGSVVTLALLGLAGGGVVDGVRKNKVIKTIKNGDAPPPG